MDIKNKTHGGKRKGAGRKLGSGVKEPTIVMRVPVSLKEIIESIISEHKNKSENTETTK